VLYFKFATAREKANSSLVFLNGLDEGAIKILKELKKEYDLKNTVLNIHYNVIAQNSSAELLC